MNVYHIIYDLAGRERNYLQQQPKLVELKFYNLTQLV